MPFRHFQILALVYLNSDFSKSGISQCKQKTTTNATHGLVIDAGLVERHDLEAVRRGPVLHGDAVARALGLELLLRPPAVADDGGVDEVDGDKVLVGAEEVPPLVVLDGGEVVPLVVVGAVEGHSGLDAGDEAVAVHDDHEVRVEEGARVAVAREPDGWRKLCICQWLG